MSYANVVPLLLDTVELEELHLRYLKRHLTEDRDKLFRAHYGFAVRTAMRYVRPEFTADEAISAACRGLLEAIIRFDPVRGRFTTFSFWWMLKFLLQERAFSRNMVRLPPGLVRQARKAGKLRATFGQDDLRVAKELGVNLAELSQIENLYVPQLNDSTGFNGWGVTEEDPSSELINKEYEEVRDKAAAAMHDTLSEMTPRDRDIVMSRQLDPPTPYGTTGKKHGLTHEGVRKIYNRLMAKLKKKCGGGARGSRLD